MQTSILTIPDEYVPDSIKTHKPLFDNRSRDITRVVVRKESVHVPEGLSTSMSFALWARPTRKNGRLEEITLPLQLRTGSEKIDTEDEFGKQLYAYAYGYFDLVLTWMRAYESKLINTPYKGDEWTTALVKACLRSVEGLEKEELSRWNKEQLDAVTFVQRMIADTQRYMQKIGLEVSVGL